MSQIREGMFFAGNDDPCLYCGETPANGAWGKPCPDAPDRAHWTPEMLRWTHDQTLASLGRDLSRAAFELEKAAKAVEALPGRLQRKVLRAQPDLDPFLLRNEAERARDGLHVHRLLDV